jgi:hypothetical protein
MHGGGLRRERENGGAGGFLAGFGLSQKKWFGRCENWGGAALSIYPMFRAASPKRDQP